MEKFHLIFISYKHTTAISFANVWDRMATLSSPCMDDTLTEEWKFQWRLYADLNGISINRSMLESRDCAAILYWKYCIHDLAFSVDCRRKLHLAARIPRARFAPYTISIMQLLRAVFFAKNLIKAKAEKHDCLARVSSCEISISSRFHTWGFIHVVNIRSLARY